MSPERKGLQTRERTAHHRVDHHALFGASDRPQAKADRDFSKH